MAIFKALLVGIDDYGDPRNNLNSCLADVQHVRNRLERDYGFSAQNITTLVDAAATVANVKAALDTLFSGVGPDDRLVFMYSGHGFQVPEGNALTEVLVLRDGFFSDDELSDRTQALPPAVLTVVFDSCFSGGMQKFFVTKSGGEATRSKVWLPDDEQAKALNLALTSGTVKRLGPFGAHAISSNHVAASEKGVVSPPVEGQPAKASVDEEGQLRINALLLSACRENETASAKRSDTQGLSAFTFALGKAIDTLGIDASPPDLHQEAERILTEMSFGQRPLLFEPPTAPQMAVASFVLGKTLYHQPIAAATDVSSMIAAAIEQALQALRKDKIMTATAVQPTIATAPTAPVAEGQEKWGFLAAALPIVLPPLIDGISSLFKTYQATESAPPQKSATVVEQGDEKWLSFLTSALPIVLPPLMDGIGSLFKTYQATGSVPQKSATVEQGDEKWLSFLTSTLPIVLPPLMDGIGSLFKTYQATGSVPQKSATVEQGDEKWLDFLASTLPIVLPPLMDGIGSLFKTYQANGAVVTTTAPVPVPS
ncbi:caspase domain-containing protein [Microlunatus sp. GCM10028923]|uniref:caspase family protein n=1 Tax=Microlunatus sp. GCM10028923 TaxID=3273400 RepID=UPI00361A2D1F